MPAAPPIKRFLSNSGVRNYRIPCQVFETLSARVYLLVGAGSPTLLDAGSSLAASTQQILAGIEAVHDEFREAVRPADVRRIIVSHGHVDHVGGLPELLRTMPAEVAIHPLDRATIASCREHVATSAVRLNAFFRRAGVDAARRSELLKMSPYRWTARENVPVGLSLEDGDELDGLRILHTPGHSPGHVCIVVGNMLLSGDHILSQTLPHLWPETAAAYTGLGHYLESLAKIERHARHRVHSGRPRAGDSRRLWPDQDDSRGAPAAVGTDAGTAPQGRPPVVDRRDRSAVVSGSNEFSGRAGRDGRRLARRIPAPARRVDPGQS